MAKRFSGCRAFVVAGVLFWGLGGNALAQELTEEGARQLQAILAEKAARTPAQRKLETSLLYARRESLGQAMVQGLPPLRRIADRARVDRDGMVVVDIRAEVTDELLRTIAGVGGRVVLAVPAFGAVRARVPIRQVEAIAALPEVRHIGARQGFLTNTGSQTSQGDAAHAAAASRTLYGIDGAGVKVGVLSDGVDSLAARQGTGDLPPTCPQAGACVQVVPGQAGSGDEGTAMLEIVHDLAPGATLFFATAFNGDASFAANILALKNTYLCDVIVDDVTYFNEGAFQDGVIAQAVNAVTAAGALYFSSAGNSGRQNAGTSGTWEGDFLDSGTTIPAFVGLPWEGLPIHSWNGLTGGSSANSDALTDDAPFAISLKWSDPLAGATTDYDLFLFDAALASIQDGSAGDQTIPGQDPFEIMGFGFPGERIVVVLWTGPTKALHLDTNRGRLTHATAGAVVGHNGGESTISVAATDGRLPGAGNPFVGGASNPVETYSSDGPRRIFFNPDGSAITPGNVLFGTGGGRDLQKPDITAADCVTTTTPGFIPFCGTSAAAPHAGAIAALLLSRTPRPSPGLVEAALAATALDTAGAGVDRDAGYGIAMADRSLAAADLAVGMSGPASVVAGADAVYTLTITHNGIGSATSVEVANPTPAGLTFVSNTGDCTTPFPCSLGTLAAGETRTITSTFSVPAGYSGPSPFTNTATVASTTSDPDPTDNSSSAQTTVTSQADLSIGKTGPASVVRGANVAYTIVVSNSGPSDAASVEVADVTPAGLTFVSNAGDCTTPFPCNYVTLAAGATRTITSTFSVPAGYSGPSPFTNTATVTSATSDPTPANNSSSAQTTVLVSADLAIDKTGPAFAIRGADLVYTIVVTNAGPGEASSVEVDDPTPAGLTFVSNAGDCTTPFPCDLGTVPSGESRTITATFSVPVDQDVDTPIVNTATVSSADDPDPTNDSSTATSLFGAFYTVTPCRMVDTRTPGQAPALQPGEERTFVLAGPPCGIPSGAAALSVNLTVTSPTAAGNLRLYPADVAVPLVSNINFSAGQTRANNAIVAASADGTVAIKVKNSSVGTVEFILDVNGYFE
jgi:uncharacterized repeat protein (TIGR01451 family)